jgi:hypothetical protein
MEGETEWTEIRDADLIVQSEQRPELRVEPSGTLNLKPVQWSLALLADHPYLDPLSLAPDSNRRQRRREGVLPVERLTERAEEGLGLHPWRRGPRRAGAPADEGAPSSRRAHRDGERDAASKRPGPHEATASREGDELLPW